MKKLTGTILGLVTLAFIIQGCAAIRTVRGSGDVSEEEHEVSGFKAIKLSGLGNLIIETGDEETLLIEAEQNLLRYFEAEVLDDTLYISARVNVIPTHPIFYYVTVKELDDIWLSGLGNVEVPEVEADRFSIKISGGGNIDIKSLKTGELVVDISGLGHLAVDAGEVESQKIIISGAGNYKARNMVSSETDIRILGLGSATVWVLDHLNVEISGGGSIRYKGNPTISKDVEFLGDIRRIDEE
jgi:hypothetical protein